MDNLTNTFKDLYQPVKGLVIYKNDLDEENQCYVESFDFSEQGRPINFHPLSQQESISLSQTLHPVTEQNAFLHIEGIMPSNILHINTSHRGFAVWYSGQRKMPLFFREDLGIPCGTAYLPPLVWKATKKTLSLFALPNTKRPETTTILQRAPFFNISSDGLVCMGNVLVKIDSGCSIHQFITVWEKYFFSSYFTHLLGSTSPVKGNIVQLWERQIATGQKFPAACLLPTSYTLKNLLQ